MSRPRRYLVIVGLLVLAGLVGFTWYLFRKSNPNFFDMEMADADELARLKTTDLPTSPPAASDEWPQFLGPTRNGVAAADHFNGDWEAKPPTVAWKAPCGGGYGSVTVAGGRVYVQDYKGGKERLVCFTAASGEQLWADEYPADYAGKLSGYAAGPRATPTIHDRRAYTVGSLGTFRCVKLNGDAPPELLWMHDLLGEYGGNLSASEMQWGFAGSPLVDGELVVVSAGGKRGAVAAFDRTSGEPRWAVGGTLGAYSTPVISTFGGRRQVVAMTGDSVVGISLPDGKTLWEYPWKTEYNMNAASPLIVGEYVFVSSDYGHGCAVLRVEATGARPVYFKKGNNGLKTKHSTAVHRDGFVYGFDGPVLKCMNLREGTFVPEWETGGGFGTVVLVGDKLLVQFKEGGLHLYDADPKEITPRGSIDATGGSWATPAVLNGRIYTRDAGRVVCVDASK